MAICPDFTPHFLALINVAYPDWQGFNDPRLEEQELAYKREAINTARARLAEGALQHLIDNGDYADFIGRVEEIGKSTNLLFLGVPRQGDLGILYHPDLDKTAFAEAFMDLLYGEGNSPERLQRFSDWAEPLGSVNKWTFPTYFLFLLHPETDLLIKPDAIKAVLKHLGEEVEFGRQPIGETYRRILEAVRRLGDCLAEEGYEASDMVDLQSFIWQALHYAKVGGVEGMEPDREEILRRLIKEYGEKYLASTEGAEHLAHYTQIRKEAKKNLGLIRATRDAGEDITDLVLLKLLPHAENEPNKAKGAWTHVAPAVQGNLKKWFQNAGWVSPENWPKISIEILAFIEGAVEHPDRVGKLCRDFNESPIGTGFQTGMLTPALNALAPDHFLLINNKSRAVINYALGLNHSQKIGDYPALNSAGHYLIQRLKSDLAAVEAEDARLEDRFDTFTHWLVAIKEFGFGHNKAWKIPAGKEQEWETWKTGGFVGLSAPGVGDCSAISKRFWKAKKKELLSEHSELTSDQLNEIFSLAHEVKEGDSLIAVGGGEVVLGIGQIVGSYEFGAGVEPEHRVSVEWQDTDRRRISEPGWKRGFHEIGPEKVERIRDLPIIDPGGEGPFSQRTFELLAGLHQNPKKAFFDDHRDEFKEHLEEPFQSLLKSVAALLPPAIREVMETEKRLFSQILKNDFGRGGAWPFYWGAFYPKGSKRIAAAQLFLWVDQSAVEFGFYLGEYADTQRDRFRSNLRRYKDGLAKVLAEQFDDSDLYFAPDRGPEGTLKLETAKRNVREWIDGFDGSEFRIVQTLSRSDALSMEEEPFRDLILHAFRRLFPLVLISISDDPMGPIADYLEAEDTGPELQPEYPLEACAAASGFELEDLETWVGAIHRKGQAVLYGPPGTGKTFMAEQLAKHMVGGGDGFFDLVQFHPSYAYEDFIQGIRPNTRPDGSLEYQNKPGRFREFCSKALNRSGTCVLIVDEVNRANLSRVFGELMFLLEYRDRAIPLAGGDTLRIPENVRLIGTMNTADRSIALVDHALRRRFAFIALRPVFEVLIRFHARTGGNVEALVGKLQEINQAIGDPNYHLGITFFLVDDLHQDLEAIWRLEIEPYLEEFFFDDESKVAQFRWEKIREEVLG